MIEILKPGSGITLQDSGRNGWRRFGVPSAGAADPASMAIANQLLGNAPDATVLEIALRGTQIRVTEPMWLALAGANSASTLAAPSARCFDAGSIVSFDQKARGRYAYLAVPGGFATDKWFNSASTDRRNGMGKQLHAGAQLRACLASPAINTERIAGRRPSELPEPLPEMEASFALYRGPQYAAFDDAARERLVGSVWSLSTRSDRTGYRLEGPVLEVPAAIPSEPVLPGSFQVPGGGGPIVTMHDGPTVGGYPKIALLGASDLGRFAQCQSGTKLHFRWID